MAERYQLITADGATISAEVTTVRQSRRHVIGNVPPLFRWRMALKVFVGWQIECYEMPPDWRPSEQEALDAARERLTTIGFLSI